VPRDDQELETRFLGVVEEYGNGPAPALLPTVFSLFAYWMSRRSVQHRLRVLATLTRRVERERGRACWALLPFVVADEDHSVVSTASLNLAVLVPPHDGDPLTGPRLVLDLAFDDHTIARVASIAAGVMLLGDARLNPLFEQAWRHLDADQRAAVARSHTPFVTAAHVDFLLGRLEHERDPNVLEALSAGLIRLRHGTASTEVFEIERVLPAWRDSHEPVRLLRRWPISGFGERIRPRLERMAAEQPGAAPIQNVLAAWIHGGH